SLYATLGECGKATSCFEALLSLKEDAGSRFKMALLLPVIPASREHMLAARATYERGLARLAADPPRLRDPLAEVGITPFYLAYQGMNDRAVLQELTRIFSAACPALRFVAPHCEAYRPDPGRRIRIGFASIFLRFEKSTVFRAME